MARRTGHYRWARVSKFPELAAAGVSPNGKLLYFYFALGPFSSFAGIGRVSLDTIASDTGLSRAEVESAAAELEKRPTPAQSFIVYDREHGIVWVRDYLKDDPARDKDPQVLNESHRKGIENILGDLAKDSPTVQKFRRYYHFTRYTPARGPDGGGGGGRADTSTNTKTNTNTNTKRARARESQESPPARPGGGATATPTNDQTHPPQTMAMGNGIGPPQAEVDARRVYHRDRLIAEGMSRNPADTLAGQIVAGEVSKYRRTGAWPTPPPPSYHDIERQIRRERPDLPDARVTFWALIRENEYKTGQPPSEITEGAKA